MPTLPKWFQDPIHQQILGLLAGGLLLRTVIAALLYPGFDEAYYYLYTQYLRWSYFDHPPLVAWTTGVGLWLTGDVSQFTIRLGTLILHTGSLLLLYWTGARLFSRRAGLLTLAIATLIPFFQVGFGTLTLPDVPLMFFWTASLAVAAAEFFPQAQSQTEYRPSYRLALLSVLVGLACLGKYHGFVLGAGLVGFCLTSPRHRRALISPWAFLGFGLFLVTLFPVLFWNFQHEWISLRFQSGRAVPAGGYRVLDLLLTFLVGVAYLFPTFGFPLWWASGKAFMQQFRGLRGRSRKLPDPQNLDSTPLEVPDLLAKQRLILWVSLPLMAGFTIMGGYRQILPGWPMPGFWSATLLLGHQAVLWQFQFPRRVRRWLQGSAWVTISILLVALLHVAFGIAQKPGDYALFGGVWPHEADPSTQLIDVKQLRRQFTDVPALQTALADSRFVFTNNFFVAGQVAMALMPLQGTPVTSFDHDPRGFAFWAEVDQWLGQDALYITSELFQEQDAIAQYGEYFQSIEKLADVPLYRGGAVVEMFKVYRARTFLKPYPWPYGDS